MVWPAKVQHLHSTVENIACRVATVNKLYSGEYVIKNYMKKQKAAFSNDWFSSLTDICSHKEQQEAH